VRFTAAGGAARFIRSETGEGDSDEPAFSTPLFQTGGDCCTGVLPGTRLRLFAQRLPCSEALSSDAANVKGVKVLVIDPERDMRPIGTPTGTGLGGVAG